MDEDLDQLSREQLIAVARRLREAPRTTEPCQGNEAIALDHLIVPARDRRAAAARLASVLGVSWADSGMGPFSAVYVSDTLTLDFDQADGAFPMLHYCFRVGEARFDALLARLKHHGIAYRSTPHGPDDFQVNTRHGGRIVYWNEPEGHVWEALTASYARAAAKGA